MIKYLATILLCLFTSAASCGGEEQVSSYMEMSIGGFLKDDQRFSASIELVRFDCNSKTNKNLDYWGVDGYCPTTIIKNLNFSIKDEPVVIPESAYSDLADVTLPLGFYVMQSTGDVKLYVRGGDGVASYTAILNISSGKVASRQIEYMNGEGDLAVDTKTF